jgi:hypothetical protein
MSSSQLSESYQSQTPPTTTEGLDQLLHLNTRILNSKLEILTSHVHERFRIHARNTERLDADKVIASDLLRRLTVAANYHLREHRETAVLYQTLFALERERREEDVECWRDLVMVMRDLLYVWDGHERAKAKAIFLSHAG